MDLIQKIRRALIGSFAAFFQFEPIISDVSVFSSVLIPRMCIIRLSLVLESI